ncbi:MAG TPA: hypothetical protein DCW52_06110 [Gammaproteobacteria bacterium]|nr:hypothetical protein [Gammaproteobacteria bacterium]
MSQTNKFSTHLSKLQWIILLAVLIALLIPRFDRADRFGLDQFTTKGNPAIEHLADAKKYIDQIRYFRGEGGVELLKAPWVYRPIPALLATPIPLEPMTALNVVNFFALCIGLFYLVRVLQKLNLSNTTVFIGGLSFVASFPVFFYGSIGYVEPVLIAWLSVGLYAIFYQKHLLYFALLLTGAFVKDPFIISLPVWLFYQLFVAQKSWIKSIAIFVIAFAAFVGSLAVAREVSNAATDFYWLPSERTLEFNVYRLRSWFSWALTLGPIGMLALAYVLKENFGLFRKPLDLTLAIGFAGAISVMIYSMFTVYVDGRYFWIAYPFMIPLGCRLIESWKIFQKT